MTDGIIKETKNSRLLKANFPATYDELVSLAANAGIPADVLFNADGWQQLPTFLNKKTLLQDSTAYVLGLIGDPTVDDAFAAQMQYTLGQFKKKLPTTFQKLMTGRLI